MRCPDTKCQGYGFAIKEPINEPTSQTPLTDAENKRTGWPSFYYDFARSLELKLQETTLWIEKSNTAQYAMELEEKLKEAERQRDEARLLTNKAHEHSALMADWRKRIEAERDQLIKVVDELAHGIEAFRDFGCAKHGTHYDVMMKCYEDYSLLPHVQAKKETI